MRRAIAALVLILSASVATTQTPRTFELTYTVLIAEAHEWGEIQHEDSGFHPAVPLSETIISSGKRNEVLKTSFVVEWGERFKHTTSLDGLEGVTNVSIEGVLAEPRSVALTGPEWVALSDVVILRDRPGSNDEYRVPELIFILNRTKE